MYIRTVMFHQQSHRENVMSVLSYLLKANLDVHCADTIERRDFDEIKSERLLLYCSKNNGIC